LYEFVRHLWPSSGAAHFPWTSTDTEKLIARSIIIETKTDDDSATLKP